MFEKYMVKALAFSSIASTTNAYLKESKLPKHTSSMTYEGSHHEHTTDSFGKFAHPFTQVGPEVQSIYYSDSKSFSTKLHRAQGSNRN